MIIKTCEFCGIKFEAKLEKRRFCNRNCQLKKYFEDSENRIRRKEYNMQYQSNLENKIRLKKLRKEYLQRPEVKEKNRILAATKHREQRREYWKDYGKRPEVRSRINEKDRIRREVDKKYAIMDRLRRSLNHAFSKYSKTGKIMSSKKYGINWEKVIDGLKPFPENIKNFEIDHIQPLHSFNLENKEEIKKAFDSSNLQWLTINENRRKSGKIIQNYNETKSLGGNLKSLISA
jgi:hypothetical protein